MSGRQLTRFFALAILVITHLWGALPEACAAGKIAILLSDDEKAYAVPVETFTDEIDMSVEVFNLLGEIKNAPAIMHKLFSEDISLIFALGAKAAYTAKIWTEDRHSIPVVFAMVINWQRYNLLKGSHNIAGIASDVTPGTQFANLTIFSPDVRRIGVIYSKEHSGQLVEMAQQASRLLDIELVAKPILKPGDFKRTYKELGNTMQGFWLLSDPVVYTLDNISWLGKKCISDKLSCIGQSRNVAKLGMLLAVDPDTHNIGSQAAAISKSILHNKKPPEEIGVMPPLGTKLYLNLKTAKKIDLDISPNALDMANEIIDQ